MQKFQIRWKIRHFKKKKREKKETWDYPLLILLKCAGPLSEKTKEGSVEYSYA
jgi:hypothetical protein